MALVSGNNTPVSTSPAISSPDSSAGVTGHGAPGAPGGPSDADGWALLDGLRRRVDEHTALALKTQTQVGQLADSIAALVSVQRERSRRINLSSFVAYVIFTVLLAAAFYLLYRARSFELGDAT